MYNETIAHGIKISTNIIEVGCTNGKTKSRLYFKNSKNEIKHVNVSYSDCEMYKIGDTISVYMNEKDDWYEIDSLSLIHQSTK